MRVLVTGGAGFIGSHVSQALIAQGHQVTVLDNLVRGKTELVPEGAAFVEADIGDDAATERALQGQDAVIHLAGSLEVAVSVERPVEYAENNVVNSVRLLESMRRAGVKKIVFSSSATVYGVPAHLPLSEDDPLGMQFNPYGASKVAVETYMGVYHQLHGFDCVLMRYFNPYGPNELCEPETHAIPNFVTATLRGEPIQLYWKGEQVRDFIYVEDLASAHIAPLELSGYHIFNVGSETGTKIIDLVETVFRIVGSRVEIEDLGERPGDVDANYASSARLRKETGWQPQVALDEGIRRTVAHYKERLGI